MGKSNLRPGTIEEFFGWINERHKIYECRATGESRPWTRDVILRDFKFTNVFRELDRGTKYLRKMTDSLPDFVGNDKLSIQQAYELEILNTVLYRMINWWETFYECGFVGVEWATEAKLAHVAREFSPAEHFEEWCVKARAREARGDKVFTSAHMTVGAAGQSKLDTVIDTVWSVLKDLQAHAEELHSINSIEGFAVYIQEQKWFGVGPFINYEISSDLRWSALRYGDGSYPEDVLTWANIGPGCKRGLQRLGLPIELDSLRQLHAVAPEFLKKHVLKHYPVKKPHGTLVAEAWPPFELREIEHSLCEFDKYSRALHNTGTPKEKFNGKGA